MQLPGRVLRTVVMVLVPAAFLAAPLGGVVDHEVAAPGSPLQQIGADIDGESSTDWFGHAVAMSDDGNRVIVGAPLATTTNSSEGHARVYEWGGGAWVQVGNDIDGAHEDENSGFSVAIDDEGYRVAVGVVGSDARGHVRVFDLVGGAWVQVGTDIDGEGVGDWSAYVAMNDDGSRIIVGAPLNDGIDTDTGHARVFEWSGTAWVQVGADIEGDVAFDEIGYSVAMSDDGSRVVVGAPQIDTTSVFDLVGGTWVQVGADIDGEAAGDLSGWSVGMSADGSRVTIGAQLNDGNGTQAGHARVFDLVGGTWVQVGADIDGEAVNDRFGSAVAISADGSRVIVGAPLNDGTDPNSDAGHARVFEWTGSAWLQVGSDLDGEASSDESGSAVAISADGSRVIVGSPLNDGTGSEAGHARVFAALCDGRLPTMLVPSGGAPVMGTGGDDVILGTPGADQVFGIGGDDLICGEGGDDILHGGNGNDTIFGGDGNDFVGGQGGVDTLHGDSGDDELAGGIGGDTMRGGDGEDLLRGQGDDDHMFGDVGIDTLFGGSGNDVIETGPGGNLGTSHVVTGNGNNDTITGSPEADMLDGQAGLDTIYGGSGDDLLTGGLGFDHLHGGYGDDDLQGAGSRDVLHGGDDDDILLGGSGPDDLFGEAGDDNLDGQGGPGDTDTCDGGTANETAGDTGANCEIEISIELH